jgi:molybdenum cofactor cytidylyltransferase
MDQSYVILPMVSAILLAAGSSERMKPRNKLLLPFRGSTVVATTCGRILAAEGIGELILVTGYESGKVERAVAGHLSLSQPAPTSHPSPGGRIPWQLVHNPDFETGMTSSIRAGVAAATGDGYMICLSDMVLITSGEYSSLAASFAARYFVDHKCICLPAYLGAKGNPVIFSSFYRAAILAHPEKEGCKTIVRANPEHQFEVEMPTDHILRDIDDPAAYQASLP